MRDLDVQLVHIQILVARLGPHCIFWPANQELVASDFPFRRLENLDGHSEGDSNPVVRDSNDVACSMDVRFRKFGDTPPIGPSSFGPPANPMYPGVKALLPDVPSAALDAQLDPIPTFQGFRRVEPRNTPTIFGVAFNFDNFWDGRARHDANGGSVFGPADPQFHIFIDPDAANGAANLQGASNGYFRPALVTEDPERAEQPVRIRFSSLGSLATGPAISDFEMSFQGRNWAKIGKKLLQASVTPLANQLVDPTDSVLGPFSNQRSVVGGTVDRPGRTGLNVSYPELIRMAFSAAPPTAISGPISGSRIPKSPHSPWPGLPAVPRRRPHASRPAW